MQGFHPQFLGNKTNFLQEQSNYIHFYCVLHQNRQFSSDSTSDWTVSTHQGMIFCIHHHEIDTCASPCRHYNFPWALWYFRRLCNRQHCHCMQNNGLIRYTCAGPTIITTSREHCGILWGFLTGWTIVAAVWIDAGVSRWFETSIKSIASAVIDAGNSRRLLASTTCIACISMTGEFIRCMPAGHASLQLPE